MNKANKRPFNWILFLACMVIIAATFLPWTISGGGMLGAVSKPNLLDTGSGFLFVILAAATLLFTVLRKRIPTYILTGCIAVLAGIQTSASVEEFAYWFGSSFGLGFYVMLAGIVLAVASHPVVMILRRKTQ